LQEPSDNCEEPSPGDSFNLVLFYSDATVDTYSAKVRERGIQSQETEAEVFLLSYIDY